MFKYMCRRVHFEISKVSFYSLESTNVRLINTVISTANLSTLFRSDGQGY